MSQYLYVFPPNFQLTPGLGDNNDNVDAIGFCMDYLYIETSVETNSHAPVYDEALKIIFEKMDAYYDDTNTEEAEKHEMILDTLALEYQLGGWNFASTNILNASAYSTTQVLQIKRNMFKERWYLHERIGYKYPVVRILEIYGFTNITISKPASPSPLWDGTFRWDGVISWDGDYTGSEWIYNVSATKPAALSTAQAEYIGKELARAFTPSYSKVHQFTLV